MEQRRPIIPLENVTDKHFSLVLANVLRETGVANYFQYNKIIIIARV